MTDKISNITMEKQGWKLNTKNSYMDQEIGGNH